jgi:hypothetical protein
MYIFLDIKVTPDAFITGSSASYTFNPGPLKFIPFLDHLSGSLVCGVDVLISLNELPGIFVCGGWGLGANKDASPRHGRFCCNNLRL